MEIGAVVKKIEFIVPHLFGNLGFTKDSVVVLTTKGERVVEAKLSNFEKLVQLSGDIEMMLLLLKEPIVVSNSTKSHNEEEDEEDIKKKGILRFIQFRVKNVTIPFGDPVKVNLEALGLHTDQQQQSKLYVGRYGVGEEMVGRKSGLITRLIRGLDTVNQKIDCIRGYGGNQYKSKLIVHQKEDKDEQEDQELKKRYFDIDLCFTYQYFFFLGDESITTGIKYLDVECVTIDLIDDNKTEEQEEQEERGEEDDDERSLLKNKRLRTTITVTKDKIRTTYILIPENKSVFSNKRRRRRSSNNIPLRKIHSGMMSFFNLTGKTVIDNTGIEKRKKKVKSFLKTIVEEEEEEEEKEEEEKDDDFEYKSDPEDEEREEVSFGENTVESPLLFNYEEEREKRKIEGEKRAEEERKKMFSGWSFGYQEEQ